MRVTNNKNETKKKETENIAETFEEKEEAAVEKTEEKKPETKVNKKITKEILEEKIKNGNFRISRNFVFKDGSKELRVDYKDTDRNYLLKNDPLIKHFKAKYPHQIFIILE